MARTHVQPGNIIEVTLAATFASGELIQVGDLAGVALNSGGSGDAISVAIDEVYTVAKLSTDDIAQGDTVYLDAANKRVTLAEDDGSSGATPYAVAGKAITAAGASTTTVAVKLNA